MPAPRRPLVLLCNDDGHLANGLRLLRSALSGLANVVVCAPETEQSTTSHSLTLTRPLRLREAEPGIFAVDGTPADCVYVALNGGTRILARAPDLVLSGVNHGLNLGTDVFYSGTVAAAREGSLRGIPAMACSADAGADLGAAAALCAKLALSFVELSPIAPPEGGIDRPPYRRRVAAPLLNVNVPRGSAWKVVATRLGLRLYEDMVEFRTDPRGREYLWIGGDGAVRHEPLAGSDTDAHDAGSVSVTPLLPDMTSSEGSALTRRLATAVSSYPAHGQS
jgi:5'-nucleotidase